MNAPRSPRPYADPYLAGVGLGLVLLASFVIAGRGLSASGAFTGAAAGLADALMPERARSSALFASYLIDGGPFDRWLLAELVGVALGGFFSALAAGRLRLEVERGAHSSRAPRLVIAFAGGVVMGLGAALARGCTSGLALTGGALLGVGSWLFMLAAFAGAYLVSPALKGLWR